MWTVGGQVRARSPQFSVAAQARVAALLRECDPLVPSSGRRLLRLTLRRLRRKPLPKLQARKAFTRGQAIGGGSSQSNSRARITTPPQSTSSRPLLLTAPWKNPRGKNTEIAALRGGGRKLEESTGCPRCLGAPKESSHCRKLESIKLNGGPGANPGS